MDTNYLLTNSGYLFIWMMMRRIISGISVSVYQNHVSSDWEKKIISGQWATRVPVALVRRFSLIGVKPLPVTDQIARPDAIVIAIWKYGIWFSCSIIVMIPVI
jgi:hypothetical protein